MPSALNLHSSIAFCPQLTEQQCLLPSTYTAAMPSALNLHSSIAFCPQLTEQQCFLSSTYTAAMPSALNLHSSKAEVLRAVLHKLQVQV
jgi:hypothetical protein